MLRSGFQFGPSVYIVILSAAKDPMGPHAQCFRALPSSLARFTKCFLLSAEWCLEGQEMDREV